MISFGKGECDHNGFWEYPCLQCAKAWEIEHPGDEVWPFVELFQDGRVDENGRLTHFQTEAERQEEMQKIFG
jgi:hypothetical protein